MLLASVALLFLVPRFLESSKPPETIATHLEAVRNTNVTGPEGTTVPVSEAVKRGWVEISKEPVNALPAVGQKKGVATYRLLNKTARPIRVQVPETKGVAPAKQVEVPPGNAEPVQANEPAASGAQSFMPIVVSVALLGGCLFVVFAKRYASADRHWAYATLGTIVGYWLKG